jgi:hypothetical protein
MSARGPSPSIDRDALRRRIETEFERRIEAGWYPFEGRWMAREAVERAIAERERVSSVRFVEVGALLVAGLFAGLLLLALTVAIGI